MQQKSALFGVLAITVVSFGWLATAPSRAPMALLYGGLDDSSAGEIIAALDTMDVRADVRGRAIYVPKSQRDTVRLALARQGLPQQGQPGFELLDNIEGYSTTSEMFDAAYWRAKEGELSRTIIATPGIEAVRVHLGVPKKTTFARGAGTVTASVTVSMTRGRLGMQQATAIRYLIALAVPNLEPEQVAIIDARRGVILKPGAVEEEVPGASASDRAKRMEQKLLQLLEARVGPGNARVSVALDIEHSGEVVSERILDPDSRILMNRDVSESTETGVEAGGQVTVASNLPEGEIGQSGAQNERTETRETLSYQYSETNRQRRRVPGSITRLQVAVLLNEKQSDSENSDSQIAERTDEEVEAIRDLVAASVGYNDARGDVVTVKVMNFHQEKIEEGEFYEPGATYFLSSNIIAILQVIVPAIVILALALFVVKPILSQSTPAAEQVLLDAAPIAGVEDQDPAIAKSPIDEMRAVASANTEVSSKILKQWLGDTEDITQLS